MEAPRVFFTCSTISPRTQNKDSPLDIHNIRVQKPEYLYFFSSNSFGKRKKQTKNFPLATQKDHDLSLTWFCLEQFIFFVEARILLCFGFFFYLNINYNNQPMFSFVAEVCLDRAKDFSAFYSAMAARKLGTHKKLGKDTARTADPI